MISSTFENMIPRLRFAALLGAVLLAAAVAQGQTEIIAKARAHLGSEAALEAVRSVHYIGRLVTKDPVDGKQLKQATVDIIFQKPDRHRITLTSDIGTEITGLDGYEAWQRNIDAQNPSKWLQNLATPDQTKRIRANTWENVSFFRGIETRGGRIEVLPTATIDGIVCSKIAFIYDPEIIFYRYFDQQTGRLVLSETESGSTIREEGVINVAGIRFPKSITTVNKNPESKAPTVTITFEQIKVNETFPDSVFAVPSLTRN